MLCKRKYEVLEDDEVAVAMLYSRSAPDFFAGCARCGHPFVDLQPGVRHSTQHPMGFYAVDLVTIGEQQPDHPINFTVGPQTELRRGWHAEQTWTICCAIRRSVCAGDEKNGPDACTRL